MGISNKQLEANRRNAQLSTGPRSPEGKARAAMNGFKNPLTGLTAIMTDEDRIAQQEFVNAYLQDLHPEGMVEFHLAKSIAHDNWRLNRIKSVEENIFAWGFEVDPGERVSSDIPEVENAFSHAISYLTHANAINKLSLYEARLSRTVDRNLDRFMKLQAKRPQRMNLSQPAKVQELKTQAAGATNEATIAQSNQPVDQQNGFARNVFPATPEAVVTIKKAA